MLLVLHPVRLTPLPLDLGPARGVKVSLVTRLVHASALLSPLLLREGGGGGCSFAAAPRWPLPAHHCTLCDVVSREILPGSAPVCDPLVFPNLRIEEQGRIVEPALGRAAPVAGLGDLALALLPARGPAVKSVVAGTRLGHCPPACSRGGTDRGLLTTISRVAFALAQCLGEIGRDLLIATGLGGSVRDPLLIGEVAAIPLAARSHLFPLTVLRSKDRGRRARREQREGGKTVTVS